MFKNNCKFKQQYNIIIQEASYRIKSNFKKEKKQGVVVLMSLPTNNC